jgi:hypothetical protein
MATCALLSATGNPVPAGHGNEHYRMALVTISQAAKLVRRGRASIYRDIEKGIVSKTVTPSGESGIETSELIRAYGRLYLPDTPADTAIQDFEAKLDTWARTKNVSRTSHDTSGDSVHAAVLAEKLKSSQHRIELLERIVGLEAAVRRETTAALKAQLESRDSVIKTLQSQVLLLEYDRPAHAQGQPAIATRQGWWSRWFSRK